MDRQLIYLARHGEIQLHGDQKRYIGQLDVALSAEGIRQAQRLGQALGAVPLAAIYCSDLQRSSRTAEIIAAPRNLRPEVRSDLREISVGQWEGLTFDEVRRRDPGAFEARGRDIVYYRPPGAESFLDCSQRVIAAFREILHSNAGNILIVGHSGVNRIIVCHVLGMPLENLLRIGQDYGCLNVIACGDSGYRLRTLNVVVAADC